MKRLIFGLTGALLVIAAQSAAAAALITQQDKLSYVMGLETGKAFHTQNIKVDSALFSEGLQDGLLNQKAKMTDAAIKQTLQSFQNQARAKMMAQFKQLAKTNAQAGKDFLAKNKEKSGVKTTSNGLQYKVITAGTGPKPTAKDTVTVDYEGKLINGKVFDSSYKRGNPATFPVKGVIPGWTEALQMMPEGSTWDLYIPAKLAYGKQGAMGAIGPNETLIFKVHLIKIKR